MQNARNMQCIYMYNICKKYVFNMQICKTLHKLCLCIDFITAKMQKKMKKYAQICQKKMQTICKQYTEYA